MVETGEAVGIMAAQSIGEPGTQLTMRTFHEGGVAGGDITQGLPRVEELFEARNPKGKATIAEIGGKIASIEENNFKFKIVIENDVEAREHITNYNTKLCVELGQTVKAGDPLTTGSIAPKELLAVTDPITAQQYIVKEVQKVYKSQGVDVSDKHIEVIVRRMISKMKVLDGGDTNLVAGLSVTLNEFAAANKPVLLRGKVDHLRGLKENVIIGKLIPAGTGAKQYSDVKFELEKEFIEDDASEALEDKLMSDDTTDEVKNSDTNNIALEENTDTSENEDIDLNITDEEETTEE